MTILKKITGYFKSIRLSLIIMLSLTGLYFLGLIIPQKWMFKTRVDYEDWVNRNLFNRVLDLLDLSDIYLSPITIKLHIFFFINLVVVIANRVPVVLRKAYISSPPDGLTCRELTMKWGARTVETSQEPGRVLTDLRMFFKKNRWSLHESREKRALVAIKNRYSPIGFLLFHVSFIFLLVGGLLLMYTRFSGSIVLTEGQPFNGEIKQFRSIDSNPKIFQKLPFLGLLIEDVKPYYEGEVPARLVVLMKIQYNDDLRTEVLEVNKPVKRGPLSIIVSNIGVSPLFVVYGPSGQFIDGAWVSLDVLRGKEDSFVFETDRRFTFYVRFFPDYIKENGIEKTASIELKNPAIHLRVLKEGREIVNKTIRPGESLKMTPFTLKWKDLRYWVEFNIVREYGNSLLIAGFILACTGLIMRLVFYQKVIWAAVDAKDGKTILCFAGKSEYFSQSFLGEVDEIVDQYKTNWLRQAEG